MTYCTHKLSLTDKGYFVCFIPLIIVLFLLQSRAVQAEANVARFKQETKALQVGFSKIYEC